jgi:hypothetical protein
LNSQSAFGEEADVAKSSYSNADVVPLRQRALPFMELLKSSHRAGVEIVWGV